MTGSTRVVVRPPGPSVEVASVGDASVGAARGAGELRLLALAMFLLHGGAFLVSLPILVLPSAVGVATFFGPTSVTPAGPSPSLVAFIVAAAGALLAWGLVGGLAAAAAEATLVRGAVGRREPADLRLVWRVVRARAITSLPILLASGWAVPRLGIAAYAELTHPSDPAVTLPVRVLAASPEALVAIAVAWLVADALGAVAARRIVLLGEGAVGASWRALALLLRRPHRSLATILTATLAPSAIVCVALAVAHLLWTEAGAGLAAGEPSALPLVASFVAAWSLGLAAAASLGVRRSATWTVAAFPAAADRHPASVLGAGPATEPEVA